MKKALALTGLIIISLTIGYLLGQHKPNNYDKEKLEPKTYFDQLIKKHIEESKRIEKEIFDSIFDDKFFSRDYNPFEEIDRFKNRIISILSNNRDLDIFNDSFSKWFSERIISTNNIVDGFEIKTHENDKKYIVEIESKSDKNSNLSIDIKPEYIKISYEKKEINEKENNKTKISSSSYISSVKYFSLPSYIKGKEYNIEREGNKIIISFEKK